MLVVFCFCFCFVLLLVSFVVVVFCCFGGVWGGGGVAGIWGAVAVYFQWLLPDLGFSMILLVWVFAVFVLFGWEVEGNKYAQPIRGEKQN